MQPHQVNGQSMYPNFHSGDYVLTDKVSYRFGEPGRGDIVVFHAPATAQCPTGTGCDFIKRVIGLPGEQIAVRDGVLFVDGLELNESYIDGSVITDPGVYTEDRTITLESNQYFVVGDNRPHSSDSRAWGPIVKSDIVGRAFFRYWPASDVGLIQSISY